MKHRPIMDLGADMGAGDDIETCDDVLSYAFRAYRSALLKDEIQSEFLLSTDQFESLWTYLGPKRWTMHRLSSKLPGFGTDTPYGPISFFCAE